VQQPLACVIVGGMLLSPICSLLVIPTLSRIFMPYVPEGEGHAELHPADDDTDIEAATGPESVSG
jgi:multidrug efflux pump subunit AcrB